MSNDNDDKFPSRIYSSINSFQELKINYTLDSSELARKAIIRVSKARASLYLDDPLIGHIIAHLEIHAVTEKKIRVIGVDPRRIYINAKAISAKSKSEIKGLLVHGCVHLIYEHYFPTKKYQKINHSNIDIIAIELFAWKTTQILEESLVGYLFSGQYKTKRKEMGFWDYFKAETISTKLVDGKLSEIQKTLPDLLLRDGIMEKGELDCSLDLFIDVFKFHDHFCSSHVTMQQFQLNISNSSFKLEMQRFNGIIRTAMTKMHRKYTRNINKIPLFDYLKKKFDANKSWDQEFQQYLHSFVKPDWNWVNPNKKLLSHGINYPTTEYENHLLILGFQLFGEYDIKQTVKVCEQVNLTFQLVPNLRIELIFNHHDVFLTKMIEPGEQIEVTEAYCRDLLKNDSIYYFDKVRPYGHKNIFEYISENNIRPNALIISGHTQQYSAFKGPDYPVLWIEKQPDYLPFGILLEYTDSE